MIRGRVLSKYFFVLSVIAIVLIMIIAGSVNYKADAAGGTYVRKLTPTPTPSRFVLPTPTQTRAMPTSTPKPPSLTISISPNPVELGGQVTVSVTGVPGDQITPYISEVALNDGFHVDSTGHFSDNEKVSAEIGSGMGITQPGTYNVYYYDWTAHVQSNTVPLVVTSGTSATPTIPAPAFNLPANTTVTATPGQAQTPDAQATVDTNAGNATVDSASATPAAGVQANSSTATPMPSGTAKPVPSLPVGATAVIVVATGAALLAMERPRKD